MLRINVGMRFCKTCQTFKSIKTDFYKKKSGRGIFYAYCVNCCIAYRKKHYTENRDSILKKSRARPNLSRFKKYGITSEEFALNIQAQNNLCAVCKKVLTDPHQDHCHTTGVNRGILCHNCNTGLGLFKDSPEVLRYAALYLENYRSTQ